MNAPLSASRTELYGKVAFALVLLVTFADMLRVRHVSGEPWQLVTVFILGGIYGILGVVGITDIAPAHAWRTAAYFTVQCALFTAAAFLNPLQGFFGLAAMPLASMAMLDLPRRWSTVVVIELWAACAGAIWLHFGRTQGLWAVTSYATAFVFTILFSELTRRAISARDRAEQLSRELAAANEQLKHLASKADELATTRERNRLAREIHDGVGHYLTTINVHIEAARALLATQPEQAAASLDTAARVSRDALDDVRRSVGALVVDAQTVPLPAAIETFARNLGLEARLHVRGAVRALPPAAEHALARAAQEGLTNVRRHAGLGEATVTLDYTSPNSVALAIEDRGRGPDARSTNGYGLRGLRERIELLGGQLSAGPRPDRGFALRLELPA